jgi:glycosyltransferase involved in cell wall biosynthesis
MLDKKIDIVVPAHNEELNLIKLIPELLRIVKNNKIFRLRLIFIDDGSNDKSQSIIKKFLKNKKFIKLIINKQRKGQTYCYKKYLSKFKSEYFIRIDGDNQDNPKYISNILSLIKKDYDIIMGNRTLRKHSILMVCLTFLYDNLIFLLIRKKLKFNDHRYLPLIAINNGAKKIKIFDTVHQKRKFGKSKYKISTKIITAFPEFLFFYLRLKIGFFK